MSGTHKHGIFYRWLLPAIIFQSVYMGRRIYNRQGSYGVCRKIRAQWYILNNHGDTGLLDSYDIRIFYFLTQN